MEDNILVKIASFEVWRSWNTTRKPWTKKKRNINIQEDITEKGGVGPIVVGQDDPGQREMKEVREEENEPSTKI